MASLHKPPKKYTRVGETRTVAEFFTSLYAYAAASQVDKAGSNCMVAMYATPARSLGPASEPIRARLRSSRLVTFDH